MNGRLFTVEEANALLPTLVPIVESILEARKRIKMSEAELARVLKAANGNGGSRRASRVVADLEVITTGIKQIEAVGCEFKGFQQGLLDFPSERDGEIVYLCWQYGEERIEWWHAIDAGYAGRTRL